MPVDGPAADANAARNAHREAGRRARWAGTRGELWALLAPHLTPGARVAVVGAGNGDDVPLGRIAAVASTVTLIDIDARTAGRARGRVRRGLRRRVRVLEHDVTLGAADRAVGEARHAADEAAAAPNAGVEVGPDTGTGAETDPLPTSPTATAPGRAPVPTARAEPLPGGPYDLVVGDLLYSQLLYPALLDAGVPADVRRATIDREGAALTRALVARLHASAPVVAHVHDRACWGNGYPQPVELDAILDAADDDPDDALALADRAKGPREADPRAAIDALGLPVVATRLWHWPFVAGVDYLVVGTVAGGR